MGYLSSRYLVFWLLLFRYLGFELLVSLPFVHHEVDQREAK